MPELTDEQLNLLWIKGVRLSAAWLEYGAPDKKAAFNAARKISVLDEIEQASQNPEMDDLDGAQRIFKIMSVASKARRPQDKARAALIEDMQHLLRSGKVVGFGFEKPRLAASVPIVIPRNHWHGRIRWDNNSVDRDALQFIAVKLVPVHWLSDVHRVEPHRTVTKPVGRPSVQKTLQTAIHRLVENGQINPSNSMTSHYDAIMEQCILIDATLSNKNPPVSSEAIRRVLSPIFNNLKKTQKL